MFRGVNLFRRIQSKRGFLSAGMFFIIFVFMGLLVWRLKTQTYVYQRFNTETTSYIKGTVTEILEENSEVSGAAAEYAAGYQKVQVRLSEGDHKGEILEIENYITAQHLVKVTKGSRVVVCADEPEQAEPYYTIYNYDRSSGIWLIAAAFLLLVVLIGKKRGLMSCIGLVFTILMVAGYLLPGLYEGQNGFLLTVITVTASCAVTCFCIGGLQKKTLLNLISAVLGGVSAGVVYWIFMAILHITGCNLDAADDLVLIAQVTGLRLGDVLLSGVMVSALGAVMDVAVSMGASLGEISGLNPEMGRTELFRSGMNIGRDMIGTMTNTLILAFAGSSLATLMVLISYGVQYNQLMSSNFLTLEAAQGIAGSMAVVLTVPISAAVCAVGYGHLNKGSEKTEPEKEHAFKQAGQKGEIV